MTEHLKFYNKDDRLAEFNKLEKMLIDAKIEYVKVVKLPIIMDYDFHQLRSEEICDDKLLWDVICHKGSYGYGDGLLEMWGKDIDEPIGWLTAEECLKKIKDILESEEKR